MEKPIINKRITHSSNYTTGHKPWKYIAMHYTANNGDTAEGNCNYYLSPNRGASAHFFVDETSIWQSVELTNKAWHIGSETGVYYHNDCRNSNCIGVEMCSRKDSNGNYYIKDEVVNNARTLVKWLMQEYNIPVSNIVRHYDVTHKECPKPWVKNPKLFEDFKNSLIEDNRRAGEIYLDKFIEKGFISDKEYWSKFDDCAIKSNVLALVDKITGGTWPSEEVDSNIHWVQPIVISLCGKKVITNTKDWLENPDAPISRALMMSLICNATGGVINAYKDRETDHWARNVLDTLCDRKIITDPKYWCEDFEAQVSIEKALEICYNYKFKI